MSSKKDAITPAAAADPNREESKEETNDQFVNEGFLLWEQSRTRWLGHAQRNDSNTSESHSSDSTARPAAVPIEVDEIIEVVFAMPRQTAADGAPPRFPRTVPLPQMVDILVDLWEAEGLDI